MKKFVTIIFVLVLTVIANLPVNAQNKGNVNQLRKEMLETFKSAKDFRRIILDEVAQLKFDSKTQRVIGYNKKINLEAGKKYDLVFISDQTFPNGVDLFVKYKNGDAETREKTIQDGDLTSIWIKTEMFDEVVFSVLNTAEFTLEA